MFRALRSFNGQTNVSVDLESIRSQLEQLEHPIIVQMGQAMGIPTCISNFEMPPSANRDNDDNSIDHGVFVASIKVRVFDSIAPHVVGCAINDEQLVKLYHLSENRINIGRLVAKAKYLDNEDIYRSLVNQGESGKDDIRQMLTNVKVEEALMERIRKKARVLLNGTTNHVFEDVVVAMFKNVLIPLTKDIEVMEITSLVHTTT
jgi:chorismate mutase